MVILETGALKVVFFFFDDLQSYRLISWMVGWLLSLKKMRSL